MNFTHASHFEVSWTGVGHARAFQALFAAVYW